MTATVFNYCERGQDPSFWAEPLNAVTNGAFILAAIAALPLLMRPYRAADLGLVALTAAIGVGSFLFHTFATGWAGAADVIPILLFMLLAVFVLFKRLFNAPWWAALGGVLIFMACMVGAFRLRALGVSFNGSIGYGPALMFLLLGGAVLWAKGRVEGVWLAAAGATFFVSLVNRSLDWELCEATGQIGAHFVWHLLNGLTLYLVMRGLFAATTPGRRAPHAA